MQSKKYEENRSINVYIQQSEVNMVELGLNFYANEAISKALTQHQSFFSWIQVYRNVAQYGKWLLNQGTNKQKLHDFIAYVFNSQTFRQVFDKIDPTLNLITSQNILFLAEIIKRHCGDLVPPSFLVLSNVLSLRRVPLLCLALGSLHLQKFNDNVYHKARTTVIKLSKYKNSLDRELYNLYESQSEVSPVQLIEIYFEEDEKQQTKVLEKPDYYRLAINLKGMNLRPPLNHNFIYLLKFLIIPEIRFFDPDIIIIEDTYPIRQMLFEQESHAYFLQQLTEIINCHCLYVKVLGYHEQYVQYDMKTVNTIKSMPIGSLDKLEMNVLKTPFGKTEEQVTLFKRNIHRQAGIIVLGLLDLYPLYNLQQHNEAQQLSADFVDGYCNFVKGWLDRTESLGFRNELTEKLKIGMQIKDRYMTMMSNTMFLEQINPKFNTIFNIRLKNYQKLPVFFTNTDQYYISYQRNMMILFRLDDFLVIKQGSIVCHKQYSDCFAGQQNPYHVTQACLVASPRYLYRLFGRLINSHSCSNRIFRLNLQTFQYEEFLSKVPLEKRCLSSGIFHDNKVLVFGGRLDSNSEEVVSRKILVITNDQDVKVEQKVSNAIFGDLVSKKLRVKTYLNNVILPVSEEHLLMLSTNAPNHHLLYSHHIYQSYYSCKKMSIIKQYRRENEVRQLLGDTVGMDRKAFQNMLLKAIVRCSYCVNRYVDEGMARMAVDVNGVLVLFEIKCHNESTSQPILVSIVNQQLVFTYKIEFVK